MLNFSKFTSLMGRALMDKVLKNTMGSHGPSWALMGRALKDLALMGPNGLDPDGTGPHGPSGLDWARPRRIQNARLCPQDSCVTNKHISLDAIRHSLI